MSAHPELAAERAAIQDFTERWISDHPSSERVVYTIPVVVHVVWNTEVQNISDAQVLSQIDVLNEDYGAANADFSGVPSVWTSITGDTEIRFQLAVTDPDGNPSNGITRTETTVTNWNGSDNVKYTSMGGIDAWPAADYLNIWVCNIGGGLLGYAYQPGISADLDGVVIGYRFFGRVGTLSTTYNLGRTTTHEIGHYFNLEHLWGPGGVNSNCTASDLVSDTPVQEGPNYGCPAWPSVSCNNGPNGDMFNNYMDYGDDECLFFFTNGQKSRMRAAINGPRASLLSSPGLVASVGEVERNAHSISVYPNPSSDVLNIRNLGVELSRCTIALHDLSGRTVLMQQVAKVGATPVSINTSELTAGSYVLSLSTADRSVTKSIHIVK